MIATVVDWIARATLVLSIICFLLWMILPVAIGFISVLLDIFFGKRWTFHLALGSFFGKMAFSLFCLSIAILIFSVLIGS